MKRDMDLVRAILMSVENGAHFDGNWHRAEIAAYSVEEIAYHVMLLHEAGLLVAQNASDMDGVDWIPMRLTWLGHEFLEAARNDTFWVKAKDKVLKNTGALSIEGLKIALGALIKQAITGQP